MTVILDGHALAARREPEIARRAAAVRAHRGREPVLLILAFSVADGHVPHVQNKLSACERVGIRAVPRVLLADVTTAAAMAALHDASAAHRPDAVFVQIPAPEGLDAGTLLDAIPVDLDVDVMTTARTDRYFAGADELPPVTVSAALLLLDEHRIDIRRRRGIVIAAASPFAAMFRAALGRRGATMDPVLDPDAPDLAARAAAADLVVASAARPDLLAADRIAPRAVVIDAGYFNPGGRGDIDTAPGIDHLDALMPVPGGIGPMTVSALLERTVLFAETRRS